MKTYRIGFETRIILDLDADLPATKDLIIGLRDLFSERNWTEKLKSIE